jgi:hypothetical protein
MARHFIERWEQSVYNDTLVLLMRTAVTHDDVAQQIQATFDELMIGPVGALGLDNVKLRGALIGTQLLGLALCRYVLRLKPIASASAEQMIADVGAPVQLQLDAPSL